jgi:hypothetical protein
LSFARPLIQDCSLQLPMSSSKFSYAQPSGTAPQGVKEEQIEYGFIGKLQGLKYEYRPDIRDRAALERLSARTS